MANKIKFGTDGWRAIIAEEFTNDNVARVSKALADYLNEQNDSNAIVLGHDCRFAGEQFVEVVAKVMLDEGIDVHLAQGFVSTPMISFATNRLGAQQGVIITASHNPPSYNGYKLKSPEGGPSSPTVISAVEAKIPDSCAIPEVDLEEMKKIGRLKMVDLEQEYFDYLNTKFDFGAIQKSGKKMAYDAMYGAGQNVMKRLFPDSLLVRCEYNPSFMGQAPEPLDKNLVPLREAIKADGNIDIGIATDGDADRIGMYDKAGNFIDAHHIILLLIHYLAHYQKMTGEVVIAFSVTDKVKTLCAHYNLPVQVTKIGFKYIAEIMVKEDVLLGGEESGGIAVKGHIPERDGLYDGILLYEFLAKTGKSLDELIAEVYEIVGPFVYQRDDLHLDEETKQRVIQDCEDNKFKNFGSYEIDRVETIDGYKYFMKTGEWLMIRPSGTEPVLRIYAEAASKEKVLDLLAQAKNTVLEG